MTTHRFPDGSRMIEIKSQHPIYSVFFAEDGKQVFSGGAEGILRQWRVGDGNQVGEPIQVGRHEFFAAALSPDRKWLVCGLQVVKLGDGIEWVGVWDAQTHEKVLNIKGHTNAVFSVDISPDSTKFVTGGIDKRAFIWSMTTGKRIVGPLQHDNWVVAVRFSPNGDRIAIQTATDSKTPGAIGLIRIYNSENGQQLLDIPFQFVGRHISSPFVWSADGRQLFALSAGEAKCFNTSSGILLSEWPIHSKGKPTSVALAHNQKFIVSSANKSLSFWDTSTHTQIGTVVEHASTLKSIALSYNDDCIATGEQNGTVTFRSLRDILPVSYFTVNVSDSTWR
jgi:WD40 repeat protein